MKTRQAALTEALLLFCLLLSLLLGGALVLVAKAPPAATTPVNLNRASTAELARALNGDIATAQKIVATRPYDDVERLSRTKLLAPATLRPLEDSLSTRSYPEVIRLFCGCGLAILLGLVALHAFLRKLYPRADPFFLPCAALLSVLSILLLFGLKDPLRDRLAFYAQAQGVLLGMVVFGIVLSKRLWERPLHRYGYLYAVSAVGLTLLLGVFGHGQGDVKLSLGLFQPVELVKVLMVCFLAAYLAERGRNLASLTPETRRTDLYPLLTLYVLPLSLFALLKDLGPVLLLFGTFLSLLYLATSKPSFVVGGVLMVGVAGWVGYLLHFGVFQSRVIMWLHPWGNTARGGDQLATGLWGMATGGPLGSGLGLGAPHYIPRSGSDLVFASVGEELGLLGTLLVLLCLLTITWRAIALSRRATTEFERYVAAGLGSLVGIQSVVIAAGCLGLFPLTGITLPFVAFGKSSLVTTWLTIGILAAISGRAGQSESAPPYFDRGTRRLGVFFLLLFCVCGARSAAVQTVLSRSYALHLVRVPDGDGVTRAHRNPRLLEILQKIPRGRILDRNGVVLAETVGKKRVYPLGAAAVHVVGILSPALGGPTGLEDELSAELRGLSGWEEALTLWQRKDVPGFSLPKGSDVRTTIDAGLQQAAYKAIVKAARSVKKQRAAAVVLDAESGAILAAVTAPSYDPNDLSPTKRAALVADTLSAPLLNRALQGRYPPGSTFKIVTASALLAAGKGTERYSGLGTATVRWRDGKVNYSRRVVNDEGEAFGSSISLHDAIVHSSNVYFANAAVALGPEAMQEMAVGYGLTRLPTRAQWGSELPDLGFGQGSLLVTPLEMASVVQAVANRGQQTTPFLHGPPPRFRNPITPELATTLADALHDVTTEGTARGIFAQLPFDVAGKTGTAQTSNGDKKSHAWFVGFAPARQPKLAFAVVIENGGYGGKTAAPAARAILESWAAERR